MLLTPDEMSALIAAGSEPAELAREIAVELRRASGDVMDGAHAEALAAAWDEALSQHEADKAAEAELAYRALFRPQPGD